MSGDRSPDGAVPDDVVPASPARAALTPPDDDPDDAARDRPVVPVAEALGMPASEFARAALGRAKAAARARGAQPGRPAPRLAGRGASSGRPGAPGAGAPGRDPVLVGDMLSRLAAERGWSEPLSVGGVVGRWREVVGDQVADHCEPETFADGLLVVRADSTAWAANLRLLVPQLLTRIAAELGPDVVREVQVLGPSGPRWAKGSRRVPGRGPRDTYG